MITCRGQFQLRDDIFSEETNLGSCFVMFQSGVTILTHPNWLQYA